MDNKYFTIAFKNRKHLTKRAILEIDALERDIASVINNAPPLIGFAVAKPDDKTECIIYFDDGSHAEGTYDSKTQQFEVPSFPLMERYVQATYWHYRTKQKWLI